MRKLVYFVGTSLDGYIAGPGGEIDFYPTGDTVMSWLGSQYPETLPTRYRQNAGIDDVPNKHYDTLVMGLGTYQPALDYGIASPYAHVRQYVVSTTLDSIDDPAVTLVRSDPLGLVRSLKQEDGLDIWLAGGGTLAGALLPEIDSLVVKSYPVLAGTGVRMITGGFQPTQFKPVAREQLDNGVVVTWYERNA
jgi:dihydrofolate reductase